MVRMKVRIFGIVAVIVISLVSACQKGEPRMPETACVAKSRPGVWIDVRSAEEFASGHLEGALHIPYDVIAEQIAQQVPDKNTEIHLYCRSGRRSGIAQETLSRLGYLKVINAGAYQKLKNGS